MSEFMHEAVPIFFMFACVLALGPIVGFAMWMAFDGDRDHSAEHAAAAHAANTVTDSPETREALGAA